MSSGELSQRDAYLVLNALPNVGPVTMNRLLTDLGGDARNIFRASASELEAVRGVGKTISETILNWSNHFDLEKEKDRMARSGATFIIPADKAYPRALKEVYDPPIGLYRKGGYEFEQACVAVVGSRRTTLYGQNVAKNIGAELAQMGFCVVSGLARGIDTAAHEGALSVGGKTAAVVGCGIDIVYPPENLELYRKIEESGAVLSEFPFGRRADRQTFPMRNRVVAGMCEATIVVETDVDGGSMITARFAMEQGRLVFAVPGRIDQPTSQGCHQLIRDGAILFTEVDDILQELSYLNGLRPAPIPASTKNPVNEERPRIGELMPEEDAVFQCFEGGAIVTVDYITERTSLSSAQVSSTLMMLELKRLVAKRSDGRFEARTE
ncbi:MAG TPA: DNA-processing protein DprA [Opitutaceae bacterium]|nr:DNA-processing protein DprA [Opitutaceae bacterium]